MYHREFGMHHPMMLEMAGHGLAMPNPGHYEMAGHGMAMPNPGHYEFGAMGVAGATLNGAIPNGAPAPNGHSCDCPGKSSIGGTLMKPEVLVAVALAVGLGMLIAK